MTARTYRRLPRRFRSHLEPTRPSWKNLGEWIRAWRCVMRDPDKTIPDPALASEGEPIPADLHLHCLECGYNLSGLTEWQCPECGEKFNPRRIHTIQMLRQPEYFLRYRYGPRDIREAFFAVLLIAVGLVLAIVGAPSFPAARATSPASYRFGSPSALFRPFPA